MFCITVLNAHASANTEETLKEHSVSEIKRLLTARNVDFSDCLEKSDLIQRVLSTEPTPEEIHQTVATAVEEGEEEKSMLAYN